MFCVGWLKWLRPQQTKIIRCWVPNAFVPRKRKAPGWCAGQEAISLDCLLAQDKYCGVLVIRIVDPPICRDLRLLLPCSRRPSSLRIYPTKTEMSVGNPLLMS